MRVEEGQPCLERTQVEALVEAVPLKGQADATTWQAVIERAHVHHVATTHVVPTRALPSRLACGVVPTVLGTNAIVRWHVRRACITVRNAVRRPAFVWQAAIDELEQSRVNEAHARVADHQNPAVTQRRARMDMTLRQSAMMPGMGEPLARVAPMTACSQIIRTRLEIGERSCHAWL